MKTYSKLYFLAALGTAMVAQGVNFELLNKTDNTFYIALGDQRKPAIDASTNDIKGVKPNYFIPGFVDPTQGVQILIIDTKFAAATNGSKVAAILYKFPPYQTGNKTFYVQLTPTGLQPQKGSIFKFGNTERGYSLKNNVTSDDIKEASLQFVDYIKK